MGGRLREVPDKRGWGLADRGKAALSPLLPVGRLHLRSRPPAAEAIFLCFCTRQVSIVFFSLFYPRGTAVVDCLGRGGAPIPLLPRLTGPVRSSRSSSISRHHKSIATISPGQPCGNDLKGTPLLVPFPCLQHCIHVLITFCTSEDILPQI